MLIATFTSWQVVPPFFWDGAKYIRIFRLKDSPLVAFNYDYNILLYIAVLIAKGSSELGWGYSLLLRCSPLYIWSKFYVHEDTSRIGIYPSEVYRIIHEHEQDYCWNPKYTI